MKHRQRMPRRTDKRMFNVTARKTKTINLIKLISAERVSRRNYKYEGTYYVTEDGEVYDKEHITNQKMQRTGISFYEITNWEYNEKRKLYEPTIRRIVIIKNTNIQLSLNL